MEDLLVGTVLGLTMGIGLTVIYLALSEREVARPSEVWIDDAIERAFEAVEKSRREA